jgi:chromosomal replication initiation ATPase DnaA
VNATNIIRAVLDYYDLPAAQFIARNRDERCVKARAVAAYLLRQHTGLSWHQISHVMQRPGHTSALTAYQKIDKRIINEPELEAEVGAILNRAAKAS